MSNQFKDGFTWIGAGIFFLLFALGCEKCIGVHDNIHVEREKTKRLQMQLDHGLTIKSNTTMESQP